MASFSARKPAPAWPPFKESYKRLADDDNIPLTYRSEIDTAATLSSTFFYGAETPHTPAFPVSTGKWYDGWRGGAKIAFSSAISVLLVNAILLLVMTTSYPHMDSMTMLYIGSCDKTEKINIIAHFLVNLLGTALLAASNYCMQILSAPTRKDIDKAHAKGSWLDIGVTSLRNLRSLRKQKVILWWFLALSSIPLHLLYNSVFFTAIATNDYAILYTTEGFLSGAAYNETAFPNSNWLNVTDIQARAPNFERLDNKACISAYATDFVTDRKDVIAVVRNNASLPASSIQKVAKNVIPPGGLNQDLNSFAWICDDPATASMAGKKNSSLCSNIAPTLEQRADQEWQSGGYEIAYCMSERIEPDCHVHFAPPIMVPVLFFNIIKAAVITYVAFFYRDTPIVTLGDAIESFSLHPDSTTAGMCLVTHDMIQAHWAKGYSAQPLRYDELRRRWGHTISWRQWTTFAIIMTLTFGGILVCILVAIDSLTPDTIANAWSLGLGRVHTQNLITGLKITSLGANAVLVTALIANAPQTLFSFVYFIYNNIFTTMALSDEWDRFSIKSGTGRYLRVSEPRGNQRSTYFLEIPYRYGLIMLATSGILHWLVSQSVFLANVSVIPLDGIKPIEDEIVTCAFSVRAMIFILVVMFAMLLWIFGNGARKFSGGMPFVSANSAAISAACHSEYSLRSEREAMVLKPLRWGVTDYGGRKTLRKSATLTTFSDPSPFDDPDQRGSIDLTPLTRNSTRDDLGVRDEYHFNLAVGHCAFSDGRVGKPVHGRLYA